MDHFDDEDYYDDAVENNFFIKPLFYDELLDDFLNELNEESDKTKNDCELENSYSYKDINLVQVFIALIPGEFVEVGLGLAFIKLGKELFHRGDRNTRSGRVAHVTINALACFIFKVIAEVVLRKLRKRHIGDVMTVCLILAKSDNLVKRNITVYITGLVDVAVVI